MKEMIEINKVINKILNEMKNSLHGSYNAKTSTMEERQWQIRRLRHLPLEMRKRKRWKVVEDGSSERSPIYRADTRGSTERTWNRCRRDHSSGTICPTETQKTSSRHLIPNNSMQGVHSP